MERRPPILETAAMVSLEKRDRQFTRLSGDKDVKVETEGHTPSLKTASAVSGEKYKSCGVGSGDVVALVLLAVPMSSFLDVEFVKFLKTERRRSIKVKRQQVENLTERKKLSEIHQLEIVFMFGKRGKQVCIIVDRWPGWMEEVTGWKKWKETHALEIVSALSSEVFILVDRWPEWVEKVRGRRKWMAPTLESASTVFGEKQGKGLARMDGDTDEEDKMEVKTPALKIAFTVSGEKQGGGLFCILKNKKMGGECDGKEEMEGIDTYTGDCFHGNDHCFDFVEHYILILPRRIWFDPNKGNILVAFHKGFNQGNDSFQLIAV
ncbi:LOW QUALITY PROTEIN: hypothetical protein MAR_021188 [Mya arenaria]|uniref:Uncharacterized protein n=1 Tax=Mya arenaria TaxID=6604 RepID=A0ABY7E9F8_MYAAR|nr:LOW QUALITY PROTEIN: hypothetical protein MAR_021188 [Mya arenaria]